MTYAYTTPSPEPGVYRMAHADYHRVNALNASRIKVLADGGSLAHLWVYDTTPRLPTANMLLGTAMHARVLEAEDYQRRKQVFAQIKPNATAETFAKHQAQWPDAIILADGWEDRVEGMRNALVANQTARKLLSAKGRNETAYFWSERGYPCRAKPDRVIDGYGFVDLKTTRDASPGEFEKNANDFGYHISAAWATRAWYALHGHGVTPHYTLVVVETEEPYGVGVYEYDQASIEAGWVECDAAVSKIKAANYPHSRPGFAEAVVPLSLPTWRARRYEGRQPSCRLEEVG